MDKTISFKDIQGFYTDEGKGKVVCLIHGFCLDGSVWDAFKKHFIKDYRVIVPDLPGYRHSQLPKGSITIEVMADFVEAILDQEQIEEAVVIGHSMGGYVTLAFADKYADKVERLGLFHSHAFADDEEKIKNRKKAIEFIERNGTEDFVRELNQNLFSKKFLKSNAKVVEQVIDNARQYSATALIESTKAMINRPDRTKVLMNLSKPVLFIIGKQDEAIPYTKSLEQTQYPEVSSVHVLQHVAHMGMLEDEEDAVKILKNFINLNI